MWPLQYCEEMSLILSSQKCVVHGCCGLCATECPMGCVSLPLRHVEGVQSSVSSYVVSSNGRSNRGTKRRREYFSCKRSPTSLISFKAWQRDHSRSEEETDASYLHIFLYAYYCRLLWQPFYLRFYCARSQYLQKCIEFFFYFSIQKFWDHINSASHLTESTYASTWLLQFQNRITISSKPHDCS